MIDVRDLEVPPADGAWDTAPDAVRRACTILVPLVALGGLRVWMVATQWPDFLLSYGRARGLDMGSEAGWVLSALRAPRQGSVLLDLGAVVLVCALVVAALHRVRAARAAGVALSAGVGVDAVSSLAYPVPWWFVVASLMLAAVTAVLVALLTRPASSMHLMPDPGQVHERMPPRLSGGDTARRS